MGAVLALGGVTKKYRRRGPWVLSGADLSLEPGSLVSIVGSNGSGKSTLLRIAAGVSSPSSGVADVPNRVGFVPEHQAARGKFTGAEYLAHMGRIRGLDSQEATARGAELLQRLGVRPGPGVPWDKLSKGNRQKVVLAQAFLGPLDAIILDEPFSGLDDHARVALDDLISEVQVQGTSVMLSSHDVPPGVRQTYRIVEGRVERVDSASPLTKKTYSRRVELLRTREESSPEALTGRTEVLKWEIDPEGLVLVLEVLPTGCDELIRAALDLGWSVASVAPVQKHGKD
jgi:ABC-type multidrug transport system ATPase subunit